MFNFIVKLPPEIILKILDLQFGKLINYLQIQMLGVLGFWGFGVLGFSFQNSKIFRV